jgi:hypothetical protein
MWTRHDARSRQKSSRDRDNPDNDEGREDEEERMLALWKQAYQHGEWLLAALGIRAPHTESIEVQSEHFNPVSEEGYRNGPA